MLQHSTYWRSTLRHTALLALAWCSAGFGWVVFAREVDELWSASATSYVLACQIIPLVFLLIVWLHAWWMDRLDRQQR